MSASGASSSGIGAATLSYRPDIDGLRALAVLAVVGFHAFPGYFPGGFLGVDVFFVISGYLITALLVREHAHTGRINLRDFYARRVRRLFPALLLVVLATVVCGAWLLFAHEFARIAKHVWASLFFVENLLLASESGYFDVSAYEKPLLHFWSLAVEEQFYIIWPLAIIALAASRRYVPLAVGAIIAGSLGVTLLGGFSEAWLFYSPLTRAWELGIGALLACWHAGYMEDSPQPQKSASTIVSLVALIALAAVILRASGRMSHPGLITLVPVLATASLIATGPAAFANRKLLSLKPAVWVGLISYPLYLWHWPLLSYLAIVSEEERGPMQLRLLAVATALLLSVGTYLIVERPVRTRLPKGRAVIGLIGGALCIALVVGAALIWRPADSDRVQAIAQEQLEGVAWRWKENDVCREEQGTDYSGFCIQNRPGEPEILLFGNSYVNHLFPGLQQHAEFGRSTIAGFGTCEVSRTFPAIHSDCDHQWKMLRTLDSGSLVLVSNQWPLFDDSGVMSDLQEGDPGAAEDYPGVAAYGEALASQIDRIAKFGHTVVILGPKPELGYDMADCYSRPLAPAKRDCRVPAAEYRAAAAPTNAILQDIAASYANVYLFDLAAVFCTAQTCDFRSPEGYPLLRDANGHLSELGSRLVAGRLNVWMRQKNIALP